MLYSDSYTQCAHLSQKNPRKPHLPILAVWVTPCCNRVLPNLPVCGVYALHVGNPDCLCVRPTILPVGLSGVCIDSRDSPVTWCCDTASPKCVHGEAARQNCAFQNYFAVSFPLRCRCRRLGRVGDDAGTAASTAAPRGARLEADQTAPTTAAASWRAGATCR